MHTALHQLSNASLKDLSVLYVEDDEAIRDQLSQFLRRRFRTLYTAADGRQGLESFRAHEPDIVVSDIRMPVMDGLEMVDAIKREKPLTPVILTTAFNETEYFLRAIDIGVDKYVMKPIEIDTLVAAIDRSASGLRAERQLRLAAAVFEAAAEGILVLDGRGRVLVANPAARMIVGSEALVDSEFAAWCVVAPPLPWPAAPAAGGEGTPWHGEIWLRRAGGETFPTWLSMAAAHSSGDAGVHHVVVFLDMSEQKRREEEVLKLNADLRSAREALERRVEERTRELVAARDAAEAASRAKTQFLSQMSHELRTPLNAVLGFAELLHNDSRRPLEEAKKRYTGEILKAGWHLVDLINDVLDMSKVDAGRLGVSIKAVTLGEVFRECLALVAPMAAQRQVRIDADGGLFDGLSVKADRIRLKQVLINLLSNAIKYNQPQGRVRVDFRLHEERLRISITDTGVGISAEDMLRLFTPFERFGAAASEEGTGIGLALSKRLVELMGGRIAATSKPGIGSTFWLELECVATPAPAAAATGNVDGGDDLSGRSVLYVEDNGVDALYMQALFASLPGTRLITVDTVDEAVAAAANDRPDVILVSAGHDGHGGDAALSRFRQLPALQSVPAVALSSGDGTDEGGPGPASGFAACLTKPVQVERLAATLRRLLRAGD